MRENEHRTANIEQPTSNNQHQTTNIEQPTSNNQHRTTNIEHRTSNNRQANGDFTFHASRFTFHVSQAATSARPPSRWPFPDAEARLTGASNKPKARRLRGP